MLKKSRKDAATSSGERSKWMIHFDSDEHITAYCSFSTPPNVFAGCVKLWALELDPPPGTLGGMGGYQEAVSNEYVDCFLLTVVFSFTDLYAYLVLRKQRTRRRRKSSMHRICKRPSRGHQRPIFTCSVSSFRIFAGERRSLILYETR